MPVSRQDVRTKTKERGLYDINKIILAYDVIKK
jgi:hypothetical protein